MMDDREANLLAKIYFYLIDRYRDEDNGETADRGEFGDQTRPAASDAPTEGPEAQRTE